MALEEIAREPAPTRVVCSDNQHFFPVDKTDATLVMALRELGISTQHGDEFGFYADQEAGRQLLEGFGVPNVVSYPLSSRRRWLGAAGAGALVMFLGPTLAGCLDSPQTNRTGGGSGQADPFAYDPNNGLGPALYGFGVEFETAQGGRNILYVEGSPRDFRDIVRVEAVIANKRVPMTYVEGGTSWEVALPTDVAGQFSATLVNAQEQYSRVIGRFPVPRINFSFNIHNPHGIPERYNRMHAKVWYSSTAKGSPDYALLPENAHLEMHEEVEDANYWLDLSGIDVTTLHQLRWRDSIGPAGGPKAPIEFIFPFRLNRLM